jgi:hypothetical protein
MRPSAVVWSVLRAPRSEEHDVLPDGDRLTVLRWAIRPRSMPRALSKSNFSSPVRDCRRSDTCRRWGSKSVTRPV